MSPGKDHTAHVLSPSLSVPSTDKLRWQGDGCGWMGTTRACTDGDDIRAKGMYAALEMMSYPFLPRSRQQQLEEAIERKAIAPSRIFKTRNLFTVDVKVHCLSTWQLRDSI